MSHTVLNNVARTLCTIFSVRYLPYHLAAIGITAGLALSGADFAYFSLMQARVPFYLLLITDITGFFMPLILPASLYIYGKRKNLPAFCTFAARLWLAIVYTFSIVLAYKSLSGRSSPDDHVAPGALPLDNSLDFHFGFMQGEMLGGWPSSHAAIAFAMAACIVAAFPTRRWVHVCAYIYAICIALGVAIGFHWLSEAFAGALLGTAIGRAIVHTYEHTKHPPYERSH
jgi:membrane-associated phospholipid phosphatase